MVVLRFRIVLALALAATALGCAGGSGRETQYPAPATRPAALVEQLLSWEPSIPTRVCDEDNPYHKAVVDEGDRIVPLLLQAMEGPHRQQMGWITGALGEIADARAFPALLKEYVARPDPQLAIRVGACMGEDEVRTLFLRFEADEPGLRALLRSVYGPQWDQASGLALDDLRSDLVKRLPVLRAQCRSWAWPKPG